ncbi:GntR family transcriptional regulator [Pannonibacter phragmitetus]|uniref:GntR family transcriptional regulator n=1 Tax=Pannonibacter phragmitetus TaxID=121719 RepID=A0A0L0IVM8_9HYPH|nr:GntR family transcriptional regulator [Pannonibacter phragmitetus]ALV26303.1 GntR family transcriptional regulator [Pannonibacter phragmitetus]KND17487.1 GntR family transcriptional regulator [Pannonibacter phragmitetus]
MAEDSEIPQGQAAYRRLLEDIRDGGLAPGMRLRETELAERLGISRTPVREAIRQLEADGLVVHLPRQGASIRTLDHAEVVELYEMRAVLEGTAARLAARAASSIELAELAALNNELAAAPAGPQARELNRQFHRTLFDAARNRFLLKSISALQKTLLILGPSTLSDPERAALAVAEHAAVLAAFEARDGAGAEAAMRAHVEAAFSARIRSMRGREIPLEDDV